jgi:hypothetical protein
VVVTVENQGMKIAGKCKLVVRWIPKGETSFANSVKKVVKFKKLPGKLSLSQIGKPANIRTINVVCPFQIYLDGKLKVKIDAGNKVKESKEDNNICLKTTGIK